MNKQILAMALGVLCGTAVMALPAFAATQAGGQPATSTGVSVQQNANPANPKHVQRAVPPLDSRTCLRDTGSHIRPAKGQCLPVHGNSYTQQDIRRTGAVDMGQALRMLDPSVTVHGH